MFKEKKEGKILAAAAATEVYILIFYESKSNALLNKAKVKTSNMQKLISDGGNFASAFLVANLLWESLLLVSFY